MQKRRNNIFFIFPILGLILLLLFSPCSVRNFLQIQLGISTTDVTNKSQIGTTSSVCVEMVFSESSNLDDIPQVALFMPKPFVTQTGNDTSLDKNAFYQSINCSILSSVPLYLLHRKLKYNL